MTADILALLLVGHLVGDWIIQTDWMAANKTVSWKANQAHIFSYHLAFLPLVLVWESGTLALLILLAWSYGTHSLIDRRWPVVTLMRATRSKAFSDQFWGILAVDQTLHLSVLLLGGAVLA